MRKNVSISVTGFASDPLRERGLLEDPRMPDLTSSKKDARRLMGADAAGVVLVKTYRGSATKYEQDSHEM